LPPIVVPAAVKANGTEPVQARSSAVPARYAALSAPFLPIGRIRCHPKAPCRGSESMFRNFRRIRRTADCRMTAEKNRMDTRTRKMEGKEKL